MSICHGLNTSIFPSKDEDNAVYEKRTIRRGVFFLRGTFSFNAPMIEVLFFIRTLNWRVKYSVSRQGKGKNKRNGCTYIVI